MHGLLLLYSLLLNPNVYGFNNIIQRLNPTDLNTNNVEFDDEPEMESFVAVETSATCPCFSAVDIVRHCGNKELFTYQN